MRKSFLTIVTFVLLLAMLAVPMMTTAVAADAEPEAQADTPLYFTYNKEFDSDYRWRKGSSSVNKMTEHTNSTYRFHASERWDGILLAWSPDVNTMYDATNYLYNNLTAVQFCPANTGTDAEWTGHSPITSIASTGAEHVAIQLDLKYDPADTAFDGFVFDQNIKAGGLAKVKADGTFVTYAADGTEITIGTLETGWNTLTAWYIPTYDDAAALNGYNVYFAIGAMTSVTSTKALAKMPYTTFATTKKFAKYYEGGYSLGNDKLAGSTGTFSLKCFVASSISTTTVKPLTVDSVDEWTIADNLNTTDWANATIDTTNNYVVKADGTRDVIAWETPDAATYPDASVTLVDGVLTFSGAPRAAFKQRLRPSLMTSDTLLAGPTYISFDFYLPKTNCGDAEFNIGGNVLAFADQWGYIYDKGAPGSWATLKKDLPAGWYTIEIVLIPEENGSVVNTSADTTVTVQTMYVRATKTADTVSTPTTISTLDLNDSSKWYKRELGSAQLKHFVDLEDTSSIGRNSNSEFKLKGIRTANLTAVDKPSATFTGYEQLNTFVNTSGETITLPAPTGVAAWELEGTYYLPGTTFIMTEDVTFTALESLIGWDMTEGYNSGTKWGSNDKTTDVSWGSYHSAEAPTPILLWYNNTSMGTYSYDATEQAITINSIKNGGNYVNWYLERPADTLKGATHFAATFQVKYTAGSFAGMRVMDSSNLVTIDSDGVCKVGTSTMGNLVDGWNTIRMYLIPTFAADGATVKSYTLYASLNSSAVDGERIAKETLFALPSITWNRTNFGDSGALKFKVNDGAATTEEPVSITLRGFKNYSMTTVTANYVDFGDDVPMMSVEAGTSLTLPTAEGIAAWSDGVSLMTVGTKYTPAISYVRLTAVREVDIALEQLASLTTILTNATTTADKVAALDALTTTLETPGLDTADARYIAAAEAKEAAVAAIKNGIKNALPEEGTTPADGNAWYTALAGAIADYNTAKAYMNMGIMETLDTAIEAYNAFVESVNEDVAESITVAVVVTVDRLPNTEIVAILADIKSKVDDGHQPG